MQKIMLAYFGLITFTLSAQLEKLSVAQTLDTTTVTLRAYIPKGDIYPILTNCISKGTTLNCDIKTKDTPSNFVPLESLVPHILSITLPYRTDVWQVNVNYHGTYYKTGS